MLASEQCIRPDAGGKGEAFGAKDDLGKSTALYDVGKAKIAAAERISGELGRKVVFDGTLPVDRTGVVDPETGTIRLNSRVGGPENLYDNALQLVQEGQAGAEVALDSSELAGYNAGEGSGARGIEVAGEISDILVDSYKNLSEMKAPRVPGRINLPKINEEDIQ